MTIRSSQINSIKPLQNWRAFMYQLINFCASIREFCNGLTI